MKPIDLFLILIIITIVTCICYFGFWKNRGNPCSNCPYSGQSNCNCKTIIILVVIEKQQSPVRFSNLQQGFF